MSRLVNTLSLKKAADIANKSTRQVLSAASAFEQASAPDVSRVKPTNQRKFAP